MAFESISPNMNLIIPAVGATSGPLYATDINQTLTLIDQHNHSPGYGVPINPAGLSINTDLTFQANNATNLRSVRFTSQASPLALVTDIGALYEAGVDLYYNDGLGNQIRLTQSGGIAGTPGSISGLSSPASATYVAGDATFVWQSNTGIAANMDFAAGTFRNITPNSTFGVTVQPVANLSSNYTLVLPTLPASQKIMTLDNAGNMSAPYTVDNSTIVISSNVIGVGVINGTTNIQAGSISSSRLNFPVDSTTQTVVASTGTFTVPAGVIAITFTMLGGGGGGGGGGGSTNSNLGANATAGGGGSGGSSGTLITQTIAVTPGDVLGISIGVGGAVGGGGAGAPTSSNGGNGGNGGDTLINTTLAYYVARGGLGGLGGHQASFTVGPSSDGNGGNSATIFDPQTGGTQTAIGGSGALNSSPATAASQAILVNQGGAGGGGGRATAFNGTAGAAGFASTGGSPGAFGAQGGGGGGGGSSTILFGQGGSGGVGASYSGSSFPAGAGFNASNYGAGGGGGGGGSGGSGNNVGNNQGAQGGQGGSGVVILTYVVPQ